MKNLGILVAIAALCAPMAYSIDKERQSMQQDEQKLRSTPTEFNRLNWVEVVHADVTLHANITFDFEETVYFQKNIINGTQLELSFPGMKMNAFNKDYVISTIKSKLQPAGLIDQIDVQENNKNIPCVVLTLTFASHRSIKTKNNKKRKIPNRLVIRWSSMENPNRLILDIFTVESLEAIKRKGNSVILHAHNNAIISDTNPSGIVFAENTTRESHDNNKIRIIIDPGHGGCDEGAIGPGGIKEKDIALHVAQKTRTQLQKSGYNVLLTRNADISMSLVERSELATQLKANLFVSIHVNSFPIPGQHISGIETFYLDGSLLLPPTRRGGFVFVNLEKDKTLATVADNILKNTINTSKKLATAIQDNLINFLRHKKIKVTDRGIKENTLRLLIRSSVPSALVEVGFITNRREAELLSTNRYQEMLAQGICQGIHKYLKNQHNN